jgi:hypothetical protein
MSADREGTYDTNRSTKDLRRQVLAETSLDNTVSTMSTSDTTPDNTDLGTVDFTLSTVDVGNTLTKVELSILGGLNTFNLNQRNVGVLVTLGTFVAQNTALAVKTIDSF